MTKLSYPKLENLGESGTGSGVYALQFRDGAFFVGTFDNCGRGSTWTNKEADASRFTHEEALRIRQRAAGGPGLFLTVYRIAAEVQA